MIEIDTPRLTLRELKLSDAPFVLELLTDPDFIRYIGDRGVRNLEQACDYIADGPMLSYRNFGFGLLLMQVKSGAAIGMCGFLQRDYFPDPDLGFALLPAYRAAGFCQEAARAVLNNAPSAEFGRVLAIVQPNNGASIRVLQNLGFSFERNFKLTAYDPELEVYVRRQGRSDVSEVESQTAMRRL
jgi:RimJ/RimL family protein N-acetyltransferase